MNGCLPILCRLLDRENHEVFIEIANPDKISAFGIEDDDHSYADNSSFAHIVDNVYVRQFMSASSILETMKKITVAYDNASGTDYADNILFSLR